MTGSFASASSRRLDELSDRLQGSCRRSEPQRSEGRSMTDSFTSSGNERLPALDGLRGVAAMIVVFSHLAQVAPSLAVTETANPEAVAGTVMRILAYSPLRIL